MARDEYGIYRKPTGSVIAAWLGIAAAIFFGAYAVKMHEHLRTAQQKEDDAREETNQVKLQLAGQLGELQALKAELQTLKENALAGGIPAAAPAEAAPVALAAKTEPATVKIAPAVPTTPTLAVEQPNLAVAPAQPGNSASERSGAAGTTRPAPEAAAPALPTETKTAAADLAEAGRLSGEILYYNPDTRKVYLSLGSALGGLQKGNRFTVWRGDQYVTDIRVEKVFSSTSTCEIEGPTPIGVRAGDIAKLALKQSGT